MLQHFFFFFLTEAGNWVFNNCIHSYCEQIKFDWFGFKRIVNAESHQFTLLGLQCSAVKYNECRDYYTWYEKKRDFK